MKRHWYLVFILFFYVVFDPSTVLAYDQVLNEKTILLTSKKSEPTVLRLDNSKGMWILDKSNSTIQKISKEGKIEATVKPGKKKQDLFREPIDFTFANDGAMVVSDPGFGRVVFIDKAKIQQELAVEKPTAVAVSKDDILAVGNLNLRAIQLYSKDGVPLHVLFAPGDAGFKSITSLSFSRDGVLWVLDGEQGNLHRFSPERKWLGVTSGLGESVMVAVDDFGFAYVSSREGRWKEIDNEGKISGTFGAKGKNPGQLSKPYGVALDGNDRLWVAEEGNVRLQLFNITNSKKETALTPQPAARIQVRNINSWTGLYKAGLVTQKGNILLFNQKKNALERFDAKGKLIGTLSFKEKGKERVTSPQGFAEDKEGNLWVTDGSDHKVKKISNDGVVTESLGEKGKKEGSLKDPSLLSIRADKSIVVVDRDHSRVQVLNPKGLFLFSVGSTGKGAGKYKTVSGLASTVEMIAIIDNDSKSLLFYDSNGKYLSAVSNPDGGAPYWKELSGISTDNSGRFYVSDKESNRIRLFSAKGEFLADFTAEVNGVAYGGPKTVLALSEKGVHLYQVDVVPKAVEKFTAADDSGNIQVQWQKNVDASLYRVYRSSITNVFAALITSPSTDTFDADVVPGVVYRYAVTGVNEMGYEGNWTFSEPIKASRRKDVSLISITTSTFEPIFTAAFKTYISKPIGMITIKNNDAKAYRDVKVSMVLKKYTDFATDTVIKEIGAGQEVKIPVSMTFNDSVLELTENTPVQAEIRIIYFEENNERIVSQNAPLLLYSRNAISWNETERISSFVTPRDLPIVDFSRAAIRSFLGQLKTSTVGKPLAKAALLYESVSALGMSYVPDPKTPYAEAAGKPDVLDYVQFPRETLSRKLGDCDDTTALIASLLESIGVETAIIDMPGHIFVMANLEENDPDAIGLPIERFVDYKNSYWVPIETTKFGKGFQDSWQAAITAVKAGQEKNQIKFVSIVDASMKYPPVTLTEVVKAPVVYPEEKVKAVYLPLMEKLQEERYQAQIETVKEKIRKNPADAMLLVQLGMVHAEGGNITEARNIFMAAIKDQSVDVQSAGHNNLGNLDYLAGDFKGAGEHYGEAAKLMPDDGGVAINRARSAWKLGDSVSAKKYLQEAKEDLPDWRDFVSDMPAELLPAN